MVLSQSFEIGYRLLIGKPSPELRFGQYALFVVLVETSEVRPRPFLSAGLRFHRGDFPNLRAAGLQHVLKCTYSRRRRGQDMSKGFDRDVFGLMGEFQGEMSKQRLVVRHDRFLCR